MSQLLGLLVALRQTPDVVHEEGGNVLIEEVEEVLAIAGGESRRGVPPEVEGGTIARVPVGDMGGELGGEIRIGGIWLFGEARVGVLLA